MGSKQQVIVFRNTGLRRSPQVLIVVLMTRVVFFQMGRHKRIQYRVFLSISKLLESGFYYLQAQAFSAYLQMTDINPSWGPRDVH